MDNGQFPIVGVIRHYADELTLAVASTSGDAFARREEELRQLRLRNPEMSEGELLLEYLKREKLNNGALRLIDDMMETGDASHLNDLREEIVKLSQQILNGER